MVGRKGGGEGDPSAFSVNLFGIPEIPEALPRARSAPPVCIILYLFRLVTSYTRPRRRRRVPSSPLARVTRSSSASYTRGKWRERRVSFSCRLSRE